VRERWSNKKKIQLAKLILPSKPGRAASAQSLLRDYHQRGDLHARQRVIEQYLPLVTALARRYAHRGEALEDLIQVGSVGLVKAVDRFEPDRRVAFAAFATPTILGEIRRHLRDATSPVRLPRRLQELELRLGRTIAELERTLNRPPTPGELARRAEIAEEEAVQALQVRQARTPVSLSAQQPDSADGGLHLSEDRALLATGFRALDPIERRVLHLYFFEGFSQSRIAAHVHVSQIQVSRLLRRSLEKMRRELAAEAPSYAGSSDGTQP
jgi:RNA polymerase sigma-B factor